MLEFVFWQWAVISRCVMRAMDDVLLRFAKCIALLYTLSVIKSFQHKGLESFFLKGSKAGIQAVHAKRLRLQLAKLDSAQTPEDMNLPGWKLHPLKGELKGYWAIWADQNWRMTFKSRTATQSWSIIGTITEEPS